ncbi:hypothetical protein FDECE_6607 [Fusarium decemcellulare]|nr:hypothetical protein FDECE_6607 [Fusarium decemcellulare]
MARSDGSDGGCLKAMTSCFRNRNKPPGTPDVSKSPNRPIPASREVCEPALLAPTTSDASAALPSTTAVTEQPQKEASRSSLLAPLSAEGSATTGSPTQQISQVQAKLDLWREAYDQVDNNTRGWIDDIIPTGTINVKDTTDDLVKMVRNGEDERKDETPKVTIGDRDIIWRDYAQRVITGLTTIGDIAIPFAPAPSSAVWSAIKVLMQASLTKLGREISVLTSLKANVSQCEDFTAILGCTDIILCIARRGRVYEEVYISNLTSDLNDAQDGLRKTLVEVYKECLEFLAFVDAELKRKRLSAFLEALVNPGHGQQRVKDIRCAEDKLDMAARPCEAYKSKENEDLLRSLQQPLNLISDGVAKVLNERAKEQVENLLNSVSRIEVGKIHGRREQDRTPRTGEWLVQDRKIFLPWERSSYSQVLWLQGDLGTGKSFLSSKVIDRYRRSGTDTMESTDRGNRGFAFFYCDRTPSASWEDILLSYIRQLGEVPQDPKRIHRDLEKFCGDRKSIQDYVTIEDCKQTLVEMINTYPRTILVLDGLDECDRDTRKKLVAVFLHLIEQSQRVLKIFIASRPEDDIRGAMESFPQMVRMNSRDNKGDIKVYVNHVISKREPWSVSEPMKNEVKKTLVETGGEM